MFAILQEIHIQNVSFFYVLFDKRVQIILGKTKTSFIANSCSLFFAFDFTKDDLLEIKFGKEVVQKKIDLSENKIMFKFKNMEIILSFRFNEAVWTALDPTITNIGKYKDRNYYVEENTLESSFTKDFKLIMNFPSFSSVTIDDSKYFVDHLNKSVIASSPAIRQNSVKSKIKYCFGKNKQSPLAFLMPSIVIDRTDLLLSAHKKLFLYLQTSSIQHLKISFENEIGEDHGAIKREFFYLLFQLLIKDVKIRSIEQISDVNQDIPCPEFFFKYDTVEERNDILEDFIDECLLDIPAFFILLGITIGALLILGETVNTNFSLMFYENLLTRNFTLKHIQDVEIQKSIRLLAEEEREEIIYTRFFAPKKNQYDYIKFGFDVVIEKMEEFSAFDFPFIFYHFELINTDTLRTMVKYNRCQMDDNEVQWLWQALESKDQSFLSKFLLFISGSGCMPRYEEETVFIFDKSKYYNEPFKASVCNRMLIIPEFENYEKLLYYLDLSILNTEGFHFV